LNKTIFFILILTLIVLYGCTTGSQMTFNQGVKKINELDEKYGVGLKSAPESTDKIDELIAQITGFKAVNEMSEPLEYLIDFRLKFLEAEKLHVEGWQWGRGSTTDWGFGCRKGYLRVKEAARLRNQSAQNGYEAVEILKTLINKYPKEVKRVNLTQKDVLFLNAFYFQEEKKAIRDGKIIESFCGGKGYGLNETA